MIVVRDIFHVKFGQAQPAIKAWKEGLPLLDRETNGGTQHRLLTDLVGPDYYTLIMESTYNSLADFEKAAPSAMARKDWKEWYQKFVPLVESGRREILNVVE